jgi:hypothetical protein
MLSVEDAIVYVSKNSAVNYKTGGRLDERASELWEGKAMNISSLYIGDLNALASA